MRDLAFPHPPPTDPHVYDVEVDADTSPATHDGRVVVLLGGARVASFDVAWAEVLAAGPPVAVRVRPDTTPHVVDGHVVFRRAGETVGVALVARTTWTPVDG